MGEFVASRVASQGMDQFTQLLRIFFWTKNNSELSIMIKLKERIKKNFQKQEEQAGAKLCQAQVRCS